MKQIYVLAILFFGMANTAVTAQETTSPWSFEAGMNAVDLYPVGENMPQGEFFDEFFNVNDHWNLGVYLGATRELTKHLSISARASIAEISKWGDLGSADESVLVNNLEYYGIDGMFNYSFTDNKLKPYIGVGGGYSWMVEGPYNMSAGNKAVIGAGTVNGAAGVKYLISDRVGLNLQFMYKHSFKDYLAKHMQHSLGITYKLGTLAKDVVVEPVDTDGDGVADVNDLCPNIAGLKEFAGCPDSDGDGVPDNLDKCPNNETGSGQGCVAPVKTVEVPVTPTTLAKVVYFDTDKANLDNNSKAIVEDIVKFSEKGSKYSISVSGYTDTVGGSNYNKALSLKRANTVKEYLASRGVSVNNITIEGLGEEKPATTNATRVGKSLNRRAELTINVTK